MITEDFMKNDKVEEQLIKFFNIKNDLNPIFDFKKEIVFTENGEKMLKEGIKTSFDHYVKINVDVDQNVLSKSLENIKCYWTTKLNKNILLFVIEINEKYYYFGINDDFWNVNMIEKTIIQ